MIQNAVGRSSDGDAALRVLGEAFVQIRGIAADAANLGCCSDAGPGRFAPDAACRAIFTLADRAHNIPEAIKTGREGYLMTQTAELSESLTRVLTRARISVGDKRIPVELSQRRWAWCVGGLVSGVFLGLMFAHLPGVLHP